MKNFTNFETFNAGTQRSVPSFPGNKWHAPNMDENQAILEKYQTPGTTANVTFPAPAGAKSTPIVAPEQPIPASPTPQFPTTVGLAEAIPQFPPNAGAEGALDDPDQVPNNVVPMGQQPDVNPNQAQVDRLRALQAARQANNEKARADLAHLLGPPPAATKASNPPEARKQFSGVIGAPDWAKTWQETPIAFNEAPVQKNPGWSITGTTRTPSSALSGPYPAAGRPASSTDSQDSTASFYDRLYGRAKTTGNQNSMRSVGRFLNRRPGAVEDFLKRNPPKDNQNG